MNQKDYITERYLGALTGMLCAKGILTKKEVKEIEKIANGRKVNEKCHQ